MLDFGFGEIAKWVAIASIGALVATGISRGIEYHKDQIDKAVVAAKQEFVIDQNTLVREKEAELRVLAKVERETIEVELRAERTKVSDLRRMLLIDHDLDRLLQKKPGLILTRVNKGTEEYFKTLEVVTQ